MSTSLEQLEKRLAADWTHLRRARGAGWSPKRLELRTALSNLDTEDTSIVVSGSLSRAMSLRKEATWTGRSL